MVPAPSLVWFRDDLRLSDHAALTAAAGRGAPLICLYVLDETSYASSRRRLGAASRWWLAQSLRALSDALAARGARLTLRRGAAAEIIAAIMREAGAREVYWNEIDALGEARLAADVAARVERQGGTWNSYRGDLLVRPAELRGKDGRGMKVFTPFWKRVLALGDPPRPLAAPARLPPSPAIASEPVDDLHLEPRNPDWAGGLQATWRPGETAAQARLEAFLASVAGYAQNRDRLDLDATSGLSPHLRFGEISPRQVWHAARFTAAERPVLAADIDKFVSELGWREFSRHLLYDHPALATESLQPTFNAFPWRNDATALRAWQRGRTGYPVVDAAMRQLWVTGGMHNRARMVVASFLVKHLLIDWREGEAWFWDTLVDADPASNPASWQWVAGCGADAAPFFRIFNPVLQGEKFDPEGRYVMRWLPELSRLPPGAIHQPWTATPLDLSAAGVTLGESYPAPIVEHGAARKRALAAHAQIRAR